jgi:hypothetical protein
MCFFYVLGVHWFFSYFRAGLQNTKASLYFAALNPFFSSHLLFDAIVKCSTLYALIVKCVLNQLMV